MKKLIYIWLLLAPMALSSCNDDDANVIEAPTATGTVTDDMGNTYGWVRVGDLDWTTSNARNGLPATEYEYYDNFDWVTLYNDYYASEREAMEWMENEYTPEYGNLMSYEEALASAPEGWRVPTDEDWKALERALGMTDADNIGWRGDGVASLLMASETGVGLGLQLAGGALRRQDYGRLLMTFENFKEYGYYWTSTMEPAYQDESMAYFRKLVFGVSGVERRCAHVVNLMSVRWCRNAVND